MLSCFHTSEHYATGRDTVPQSTEQRVCLVTVLTTPVVLTSYERSYCLPGTSDSSVLRYAHI